MVFDLWCGGVDLLGFVCCGGGVGGIGYVFV